MHLHEQARGQAHGERLQNFGGELGQLGAGFVVVQLFWHFRLLRFFRLYDILHSAGILRKDGAMTTENRILKAATELLDQATRLWQAALAYMKAGKDDELGAHLVNE